MANPFLLPPVICVGQGAINNIVSEAGKLGVGKAVLITDKGVSEAGLAEQVMQKLQKGRLPVELYTDVEPEPGAANVEKAAAYIKDRGCDLVIALGGGSAIDVAKTAAVLCKNDGTVKDYAGIDKIPSPGLPTIAIPTTAGTGAEVTMNAIFTFPEKKAKIGLVSRHLMCRVVIVDPEMTLTSPPSVTASAGMDALVHAVESYTAIRATAHTELYAERAIAKISANLRDAVANGSDISARTEMCWGSFFAGISLANAGVGAVHALAYPLGGQFHIAHGIANSILFAPVMEFNLVGNIKKFARIAALMGENTADRSPREAAQMTVKAIRELAQDVGIPRTIGEVGVKEKDIAGLVEGAASQSRLLSNNPREMPLAEIEALYYKALTGDV